MLQLFVLFLTLRRLNVLDILALAGGCRPVAAKQCDSLLCGACRLLSLAMSNSTLAVVCARVCVCVWLEHT